METLLYFLLFGAFIFLMMRFGCGAHIMGHGHGKSSSHGSGEAGRRARWTPPEKDVDPVCKMTVETATAKSVVHDGRVYYFCSSNCRDKFEASPAAYIGAIDSAPKMEHSHEHRH